MSRIILKEKFDGIYVPQFQLAYICDMNLPSHKQMVKLCHDVNYILWCKQEL